MKAREPGVNQHERDVIKQSKPESAATWESGVWLR
jgi:hypothetical protein